MWSFLPKVAKDIILFYFMWHFGILVPFMIVSSGGVEGVLTNQISKRGGHNLLQAKKLTNLPTIIISYR
jgi:hypothetical protein